MIYEKYRTLFNTILFKGYNIFINAETFLLQPRFLMLFAIREIEKQNVIYR